MVDTDVENFKELIKFIVKNACLLKNNYVCIFSQNQEEFDEFLSLAKKISKGILEQTFSGHLFQINPIETISGKAQLLRIRIPDKTRFERSDADFSVSDIKAFRKNYLSKKEFKLIKRENCERIELIDSGFNVRTYFSNQPLDLQFADKLV